MNVWRKVCQRYLVSHKDDKFIIFIQNSNLTSPYSRKGNVLLRPSVESREVQLYNKFTVLLTYFQVV